MDKNSNEMIFRFAKKTDIKKISEIHMECSLKQIDGFMHRLGSSFLREYYNILLSEKTSIILVAEDLNGNIAGFHSGSIDPEEHSKALKNNSLKLLFSLLPKFLLNPKLLSEIVLRKKSLSTKSVENVYSSKVGPRAEYWAWSPSYQGVNHSLLLQSKWGRIINILGYEYYFLEVDSRNKLVMNFYKIKSAEIIEELSLPDGRKRSIIRLPTNK
jgi:hypothetical protein